MFKRKIVATLLIFTVVFFSKNSFVNAEEVYFTNENGVSMTEKEYNFFSEMYNKNYPKVVTQDIYDMFKDGNYFNGKIKSNTYTEETKSNTRGTFHSSANKSIRISA